MLASLLAGPAPHLHPSFKKLAASSLVPQHKPARKAAKRRLPARRSAPLASRQPDFRFNPPLTANANPRIHAGNRCRTNGPWPLKRQREDALTTLTLFLFVCAARRSVNQSRRTVRTSRSADPPACILQAAPRWGGTTRPSLAATPQTPICKHAAHLHINHRRRQPEDGLCPSGPTHVYASGHVCGSPNGPQVRAAPAPGVVDPTEFSDTTKRGAHTPGSPILQPHAHFTHNDASCRHRKDATPIAIAITPNPTKPVQSTNPTPLQSTPHTHTKKRSPTPGSTNRESTTPPTTPQERAALTGGNPRTPGGSTLPVSCPGGTKVVFLGVGPYPPLHAPGKRLRAKVRMDQQPRGAKKPPPPGRRGSVRPGGGGFGFGKKDHAVTKH